MIGRETAKRDLSASRCASVPQGRDRQQDLYLWTRVGRLRRLFKERDRRKSPALISQGDKLSSRLGLKNQVGALGPRGGGDGAAI